MYILSSTVIASYFNWIITDVFVTKTLMASMIIEITGIF